ncbi:hypothetical protein PTKU64_68420 [Paraburkholderia terrae]|uniref:DUF4154 domain-containing protein n=1 Tax=Paraburkholderia terrae TaxID=311230 RepID=A0ABM7TVQ3_9BURK|nr:YfiR family protein [Paraburkholderia terrae]BCZ83167.1 hypothetical protein PTKU64_68420 [Paraburkholderia terrae]
MHMRVRATSAFRAAATTPRGAAMVAAQPTSGWRGWAASPCNALLAVACALSAAPAALAETPANAAGPASAAPAVNSASQPEPAISPSDAAVRQAVLGIVSFTRWPTPPTRLRMCVTGRPDYAHGLVDTLQVGSTPLDVQRIGFGDPAIGTRCDVVYFGNLSDDEREQIRAAVVGHPVLTISEHNPSCAVGSMFCLNVDGERVTFEINLDAVARSGVRVHPNVLKLARPALTP